MKSRVLSAKLFLAANRTARRKKERLLPDIGAVSGKISWHLIFEWFSSDSYLIGLDVFLIYTGNTIYVIYNVHYNISYIMYIYVM